MAPAGGSRLGRGPYVKNNQGEGLHSFSNWQHTPMCTKGSLRQFRWALSPPGLLFFWLLKSWAVSCTNLNMEFCMCRLHTAHTHTHTHRYPPVCDISRTSWSVPCLTSKRGNKDKSSRAANLSLSKKVLLSLKKHILRWKKVFLREERASWARSVHHEHKARSPFGRGPGPA